MLDALERALERGLKLVQLREPGLGAEERASSSASRRIGRAHRYGCKVMVKAPHAGADGIHFTAAELMQLLQADRDIGLVAASCHTREELERAMALELDFAVLGPVQGESGRGAARLGALRRDRARHDAFPVYAIGGLTPRRPGGRLARGRARRRDDPRRLAIA